MNPDTSRMKQEIEDTFQQYMQAYFTERDIGKTLAFLSADLLGFGTGRDERADLPEEFRELYVRDLEQASNPIRYEYRYLDFNVISDTVGAVLAEFDIETEIDGQPLQLNNVRGLLVFRKQDEHWRIVRKHMSLPYVEQETGESYPIAELTERNRILEKMVSEKTRELSEKNRELTGALQEVKKLSGLLPICMACKKVRDSRGYWHQVEAYITDHSEAQFSHGICEDCMVELYPGTCSKNPEHAADE